MSAATRDPISTLFDGPARRLLERAYARPGAWVMTRVADPGPGGIAYGADRPSVAGGTGLNARTRWCRAFVRALYFQHKWYSGAHGSGWRAQRRTAPRSAGALRVQVGVHRPATGIIPAGRAVRIRIDRGGQAKERAVRRMPDSARIFRDDGSTAARWSDPNLRDWVS
jgi:hypothetical protein